MTFLARYPGKCGACDERFSEGDPIRFKDNEYVHDDCTPKLEVATMPPCPECFTVPSVTGRCMCP